MLKLSQHDMFASIENQCTLLPNSIFSTKKILILPHLDHLYHMLGNSVMQFPELFQGAHVSIQIEKYV